MRLTLHEAPSPAKDAALAFVAAVPARWRWMYEAGPLLYHYFDKHDSGYPPAEAPRL